MRSLIEFVPAALRPKGDEPPPASKLPLMHDTCGCIKEPGCCGREGWHFRPFDRRDVEREIDRALATLPQGSSDNERRVVEEGARRIAESYLGIQIAYEFCPPFREALRRQIDERRARKGEKKADWSDDL